MEVRFGIIVPSLNVVDVSTNGPAAFATPSICDHADNIVAPITIKLIERRAINIPDFAMGLFTNWNYIISESPICIQGQTFARAKTPKRAHSRVLCPGTFRQCTGLIISVGVVRIIKKGKRELH